MSLALGSMLVSLLGAVPFALFWVLATAWLDPAWSPAETVRQNSAEAVPIRS